MSGTTFDTVWGVKIMSALFIWSLWFNKDTYMYIYTQRQATGLWHVSVKDDHASCKYGIIFSVHVLSALWFSVWRKRWILERNNLLLIGLTGVMKCKYFDQINTMAEVLLEDVYVKNRLESDLDSKQLLYGMGAWKEAFSRKA